MANDIRMELRLLDMEMRQGNSPEQEQVKHPMKYVILGGSRAGQQNCPSCPEFVHWTVASRAQYLETEQLWKDNIEFQTELEQNKTNAMIGDQTASEQGINTSNISTKTAYKIASDIKGMWTEYKAENALAKEYITAHKANVKMLVDHAKSALASDIDGPMLQRIEHVEYWINSLKWHYLQRSQNTTAFVHQNYMLKLRRMERYARRLRKMFKLETKGAQDAVSLMERVRATAASAGAAAGAAVGLARPSPADWRRVAAEVERSTGAPAEQFLARAVPLHLRNVSLLESETRVSNPTGGGSTGEIPFNFQVAYYKAWLGCQMQGVTTADCVNATQIGTPEAMFPLPTIGLWNYQFWHPDAKNSKAMWDHWHGGDDTSTWGHGYEMGSYAAAIRSEGQGGDEVGTGVMASQAFTTPRPVDTPLEDLRKSTETMERAMYDTWRTRAEPANSIMGRWDKMFSRKLKDGIYGIDHEFKEVAGNIGGDYGRMRRKTREMASAIEKSFTDIVIDRTNDMKDAFAYGMLNYGDAQQSMTAGLVEPQGILNSMTDKVEVAHNYLDDQREVEARKFEDALKRLKASKASNKNQTDWLLASAEAFRQERKNAVGADAEFLTESLRNTTVARQAEIQEAEVAEKQNATDDAQEVLDAYNLLKEGLQTEKMEVNAELSNQSTVVKDMQRKRRILFNTFAPIDRRMDKQLRDIIESGLEEERYTESKVQQDDANVMREVRHADAAATTEAKEVEFQQDSVAKDVEAKMANARVQADGDMRRVLDSIQGKIQRLKINPPKKLDTYKLDEAMPMTNQAVDKAQKWAADNFQTFQKRLTTLGTKLVDDVSASLGSARQIVDGQKAEALGAMKRQATEQKQAAADLYASADVPQDDSGQLEDFRATAKNAQKVLRSAETARRKVSKLSRDSWGAVKSKLQDALALGLPVAQLEPELAAASATALEAADAATAAASQSARDEFAKGATQRRELLAKAEREATAARERRKKALLHLRTSATMAMRNVAHAQTGAELQLHYAAGNETALAETARRVSTQARGQAKAVAHLMQLSGEEAEAELARRADRLQAMVVAQAGNMSHLVQAEVAAIAQGQAKGVAAILADASRSDAEKAEAIRLLEEATKARIAKATGVVLDAGTSLLRFGSEEEHFQMAMSEEDREMGMILKKEAALEVAKVASERVTLTNHAAEIDRVVAKIVERLEALGESLTEEQRRALQEFRDFREGTREAVKKHRAAAEAVAKWASTLKDHVLAEPGDAVPLITMVSYPPTIPVKEVRDRLLNAAKAFRLGATLQVLQGTLDSAKLLSSATGATGRAQRSLTAQQRDLAAHLFDTGMRLLREGGHHLQAEALEIKRNGGMVWKDGEFQNIIADQTVQHDYAARQDMGDLESQMAQIVDKTAREVQSDAVTAQVAVAHAEKELAEEGEKFAAKAAKAAEGIAQNQTMKVGGPPRTGFELTAERLAQLDRDEDAAVEVANQLKKRVGAVDGLLDRVELGREAAHKERAEKADRARMDALMKLSAVVSQSELSLSEQKTARRLKSHERETEAIIARTRAAERAASEILGQAAVVA